MSYNKEWYNKNKDKILANRVVYNRNRRKKYTWRIWRIKLESPCSCGESDPRALEFHHREGKEKDGTISDFIRQGVSWTRIAQEIEKCDILCSNCHKKIHVPWKEEPIYDELPYQIGNIKR